MSVIWMDDFSCYGSGTTGAARMLNGNYANSASASIDADPAPSGTGQLVLKMPGVSAASFNNNALFCRKVLPVAETTVGVAGRFWLTSLPSSTSQLPYYAYFVDTSNKLIGYITINPSGYVQAYRNDTTGLVLIGQSDTPVMIANAWRHVEIKWVFDVAAGSVEVRLEGVQVLLATGIRTTSNVAGTAATCSGVIWASIKDSVGNGPSCYMKDLIIWDNLGTTSNDFMGSCQVFKIIPTADVSLGWTPSTGTTGYNLINADTPDDDSGYISADSTPPGPSIFTMSDLPIDVTSVRAVMSMNRSRKTDGGDGNLQASVILATDTSNGSDRAITTAYTYWTDMFNLAPDGANWSKSKVDSTELKISRTV